MASGSRLAELQDRLLQALGRDAAARAELVRGMLGRGPAEVVAYWLQLAVAAGIATLGLVLASTAVLIGAMLVAPLMTPIVGLALGLASGSPFLVLRSAGRILLSVGAVLLGATLLTLTLPFHELNGEISARASPTILDLAVAAFCALAGVYATLRPGSDTMTTAAGTSISISLVPPLCASGYGFGTAAWSVAGGAALLFLTNLVAIIGVGTLFFVAVGFNRVPALALERAELSEGDHDARFSRWLAQRLSRLFTSRFGPWLRFSMPLVLVAAVWLPLRRALDEVAWEVRTRSAVRRAIDAEQARVVQSHLRLERHTVDLAVLLLGSTHQATALHDRLRTAIADVAGVTPRVEVTAVPDAASLAGLESAMLERTRAPAPPTPSAATELAATLDAVNQALHDAWPSHSAGAVLASTLASSGEPLRLRVVHLGAPLGADAREAVQRSVSAALERPCELTDVAVPAEQLDRTRGDLALVTRVAAAAEATTDVPAVSVCVTRPELPPDAPAEDGDLARALTAALAAHPRVTTQSGAAFAVRFSASPCSEGAPAAPPASATPNPSTVPGPPGSAQTKPAALDPKQEPDPNAASAPPSAPRE